MRNVASIIGVILVGCSAAKDVSPRAETSTSRFAVPHVKGEPTIAIGNPFDGTNLPIIAVWEAGPGKIADTNCPYLRVAVWADGKLVFARDPNVWNHDLLFAQLSDQVLAKLKQNIHRSGVFDIKGHCHLVPDAPVDCIMLSFDGSQQMLYWDEVEINSYGINANPTQQHLAFKKAWWEVNRLILSTIPDKAKKLDARFLSPPKEWYLKEMIESE
jgi:hypothetical protein